MRIDRSAVDLADPPCPILIRVDNHDPAPRTRVGVEPRRDRAGVTRAENEGAAEMQRILVPRERVAHIRDKKRKHEGSQFVSGRRLVGFEANLQAFLWENGVARERPIVGPLAVAKNLPLAVVALRIAMERMAGIAVVAVAGRVPEDSDVIPGGDPDDARADLDGTPDATVAEDEAAVGEKLLPPWMDRARIGGEPEAAMEGDAKHLDQNLVGLQIPQGGRLDPGLELPGSRSDPPGGQLGGFEWLGRFMHCGRSSLREVATPALVMRTSAAPSLQKELPSHNFATCDVPT